MPVVAPAGIAIDVEYLVSVELTVNVPVAICVLVGDARVPKVSLVFAYQAVQVIVVKSEFAKSTLNVAVLPAKCCELLASIL